MYIQASGGHGTPYHVDGLKRFVERLINELYQTYVSYWKTKTNSDITAKMESMKNGVDTALKRINDWFSHKHQQSNDPVSSSLDNIAKEICQYLIGEIESIHSMMHKTVMSSLENLPILCDDEDSPETAPSKEELKRRVKYNVSILMNSTKDLFVCGHEINLKAFDAHALTTVFTVIMELVIGSLDNKPAEENSSEFGRRLNIFFPKILDLFRILNNPKAYLTGENEKLFNSTKQVTSIIPLHSFILNRFYIHNFLNPCKPMFTGDT